MWSILIILRFHVYNFTHSLEFSGHPKSSTNVCPLSAAHVCREAHIWVARLTSSWLRTDKGILCLLGSALPCLFCSVFGAAFLSCLLLVGGFAVCNGPQAWTGVLSGCPVCRRAVTCPRGRGHVADDLHLGTNHRAEDHEFNANKSTVDTKYTAFKQENTQNTLCIDWLAKTL